MSKVQVDKVVNLSDDGAPQLTYGAELPVGYGLTGAGGLNISGVVTAASAVFSGNVTIGGTLTYEDVTNIDSVGIVTARAGVNISGGQLLVGDGLTIGNAGVATFANGSTSANSVKFGNSGDLSIYHDGSTSNIVNTSGTLNVGVNNFVVKRQGLDETMLYCQANGAVSAYYDNAVKFNTTKFGTVTTGIATATEGDITSQLLVGSGITMGSAGVTTFSGTSDVHLHDNVRLNIGDSSDLSIYHDGSNSHIHDSGQGVIYVRTNNFQVNNAANNESMIYASADGSVQAYYNNSKKFETTNEGTVTTGIATATEFVPTVQPYGTKNLIINGGMNVNQYGSSSSTSTGKQIFDRWYPNWNAGTITQSKETLTSGGAYDAGHRSCLRLTNTSAAGSAAGTYVEVYYKFEAQDLAKSGWNYKSSSSYITLSFWLRSSVAQTYSCSIGSRDGSVYYHPFTAVISSANTWTKITKTFAGNSNLTINDDTGDGLIMWVNPMQGSNFHNNSWDTNGWFAASGNSLFAGTTTTTWATTAGATWDITGFQLEVGSAATPFEHRSFGDELAKCQRYAFVIPYGGSSSNTQMIPNLESFAQSSTEIQVQATFPVPMRTEPSYTGSATNCDFFAAAPSADFTLDGLAAYVTVTGDNITSMNIRKTSASGVTAGQAGRLIFRAASGYLIFDAEL